MLSVLHVPPVYPPLRLNEGRIGRAGSRKNILLFLNASSDRRKDALKCIPSKYNAEHDYYVINERRNEDTIIQIIKQMASKLNNTDSIFAYDSGSGFAVWSEENDCFRIYSTRISEITGQVVVK